MMAGHEKWEIRHAASKGWCVTTVDAYPRPVAVGLTEETARQIVREHNMHERMLDACKKAIAILGPLPRCDCERCKAAAVLRDLIAEAEKGD